MLLTSYNVSLILSVMKSMDSAAKTVWAESIATAVARTTPAPASMPVGGHADVDLYSVLQYTSLANALKFAAASYSYGQAA